MVRSRDDGFDALATGRDSLAALLWVGINPVRHEAGRISACTTGLAGFGMMEMEVQGSDRPLQEVLRALEEAAEYQIDSYVRLDDGATFRFGEDGRCRVRHLPSRFVPGSTVTVLEW
jgi:hypothetical protein